MATLKEPFALDRSLNTTEVTPRNIADVLAEGLSHITGRTASEVEYDNTDSGLTADNVQDAIDEVNGKVPTLPSVDIQTAVDEFETYNGGLLSECKVALSPIQDLSHGDPSPTNICPISGHTQVDVDISDGQTTQEQVTVNLGGTYYSGTLDVVSGVFTPDTASVDLGTLTWTYEALWGVGSDFYAVISGIKPTSSYDEITTAITEQYKAVSRNTMYNNTGSFMAVMTNGAVKIRDNRYSDEASFTSAVSGVKLVYPLATPTPIQLSPTMVKALVGENHLSAPLEGQEITESKYRELFTWDEVEAYVNAHSGGGSGMNYSTEEQVVGTWIDGKPLYQKSISINGVSIPTNQTVTIYTQANISMKYFSGYLTENNITYVIPEIGVRIQQSGDNIQISSQSGSSWTISEGYVTIRYTKTTD